MVFSPKTIIIRKKYLCRNANRKDGDGQGQRSVIRQEPSIQEQKRASKPVSAAQFANQDQKRAVRQVSPVQFADHRKSNNQSSGSVSEPKLDY